MLLFQCICALVSMHNWILFLLNDTATWRNYLMLSYLLFSELESGDWWLESHPRFSGNDHNNLTVTSTTHIYILLFKKKNLLRAQFFNSLETPQQKTQSLTITNCAYHTLFVSFLGNDDHKSTYNLSELVSNLSPTPCQPNVHLWDATSIGALLGKLTAAEVMKESGQRRLLESIFVYGLAIVDEVRLASNQMGKRTSKYWK